ncbi:MAG: hypothetical protein ABIU54_09200 [Candidatus Eisenbacteria bacterium]
MAGLLMVGTAHAQVQFRTSRGNTQALILEDDPGRRMALNEALESPRSQHPMPPLTAQQAQALRRAQDLRLAGLYERARDSLQVLQKQVPHHPWLLTELARVHLGRNDPASVERLLRSERAAAHDSLLGGRELVTAYERLAKPREALATMLDVWSASADEAEWTAPKMLRFAAIEPRATRELMRAATLRAPMRADLARAEALVLSRVGAPTEAAGVLHRLDAASPHRTPQRFLFAEEVITSGVRADSAAAVEALLDLTSDPAAQPEMRVASARRAFDLAAGSGREIDLAPRLTQALRDIPASRWGGGLLLSVTRALRQGGRTVEARALLNSEPSLASNVPELRLETLLGDLREHPSMQLVASLDSLASRWSPARFPLAEAQFFTGAIDSALANYGRVTKDPRHPQAGAAFDRLYLLEEAPTSPAVRVLGRIEWERWRGQAARARALADSLYRVTPRSGPLGAHTALELAELRMDGNDARGALGPLLAVADSLPDDRLAPRARQRAGDAYLSLGDAGNALAQYEECLARYPKAWNAPEVRRRVEQLRKARRS